VSLPFQARRLALLIRFYRTSLKIFTILTDIRSTPVSDGSEGKTVRIVPCGLILACCCLALTGCGLFRNQSGGSKSWGFSPTAAQGKTTSAPSDPLPNDDPLIKGSASANQTTILAGKVFDASGGPLKNAYIRKTPLDAGGGKEAPIDVAVLSDGSFSMPDVQPGKRYKLEARAMQDGKFVAQTIATTAPNIHVYFTKLKPENVTAETPPLPPPPGFPSAPKTAQADPEQDKKKKLTPATPPASIGQVGAPVPKGQKGTLNIAAPVPPGNDFASGEHPAPPWNAAPAPNDPPKFIPGIVAGPADPTKLPLMQSKPNVPPPPPPDWDDPLSKGSAPGIGSGGAAHVPSCVIVNNKLKNFALPDFSSGGKPWEWKANRLGKLVLLDFWRTDCPPCLKGIANLRYLQAKYGPSGLEILGIAAEHKGPLEEQKFRIASVCQVHQTNYRILMTTGPNDPVLNSFSIYQLPTLILLNEQGDILWRHEGGLNDGDMKALELHLQMKLGS
jgi:thiol-disulfide isomerase/thioredoxin